MLQIDDDDDEIDLASILLTFVQQLGHETMTLFTAANCSSAPSI
jgi:hypothetical protein